MQSDSFPFFEIMDASNRHPPYDFGKFEPFELLDLFSLKYLDAIIQSFR